jgi:hypothetical protein
LKRTHPEPNTLNPFDDLKHLLMNVAKTNLETIAKVFELSVQPHGISVSEMNSDKLENSSGGGVTACFGPVSTVELIIDCAYANDKVDIDMEVYRVLQQSVAAILAKSPLEFAEKTCGPPVEVNSGWDDDDVDFDEPSTDHSQNSIVPIPHHSQPHSITLHTRIALFEAHIDALDILAKYKVQKSLRFFVENPLVQSEEPNQQLQQQRLLLVRLARSLISGSALTGSTAIQTTVSDWMVLLDDLRHAVRLGLFGSTSETCNHQVFEEVLKAALSCGRELYFVRVPCNEFNACIYHIELYVDSGNQDLM